MKLKQLTQALADANIPFHTGVTRGELYIDAVLIVCGGNAFVKQIEGLRFFCTSSDGIPLKKLELKDIQPMIRHYRKFHPALPEISSSEV